MQVFIKLKEKFIVISKLKVIETLQNCFSFLSFYLDYCFLTWNILLKFVFKVLIKSFLYKLLK